MRALYLGWVTSLFIFILVGMTLYKFFILNINLPITDILISSIIGYILATLVNILLLSYLKMDIIYTVTGLIDAIFKQFYWTHGAKIQGFLVGQFLYYVFIYNYDLKKSFLMLLVPFFR